jgi:hypothetical protein
VHRRSSLSWLPLGFVLFACNGEDPTDVGAGGTGPSFGGSTQETSVTTTGGSAVGSGGQSSSANTTVAGTSAKGGNGPSVGGTRSTTGGTPSVGGVANQGGTSSVGGVASTGATTSRGGTTSTGATTSRGGTTSTGGTTSRGGTTSTGGTTSGGTCSVAPVNPKATQQVKNLLCYLYSIYGKNVLSGQQETSWSNPANDISWYATNGMKTPAILGGDFLYPSGTTTRAIAYWNAGGLTMIRYHMGAPPLSDTYENSKGSANIGNVLTNGTAENTSFKSKLDYVATELKKLEDANVPVIWAPFHEFQPNGWFWWSKGTSAQFNELWKYMFDYLTNTKGINNLLWLAPSSGTPTNGWFPNKSYYDIAGPDTYDKGVPFASMYATTRSIVGSTVPIPLHETGYVPDPATMFPSTAPWLLFNIWAGYQTGGYSSLAQIKKTYEDAHTITRDELPNLK